MGGGSAEVRALQDRVSALMDEMERLRKRVLVLEDGGVALVAPRVGAKPAVTAPVRAVSGKRGR